MPLAVLARQMAAHAGKKAAYRFIAQKKVEKRRQALFSTGTAGSEWRA